MLLRVFAIHTLRLHPDTPDIAYDRRFCLGFLGILEFCILCGDYYSNCRLTCACDGGRHGLLRVPFRDKMNVKLQARRARTCTLRLIN